MSDFSASPEALAQASRDVRAAADRLEERVKALAARVEALLDGGWRGQAADRFRVDWESWRDGANAVIGGLDTTSGLLADAGQRYREQDLANADHMRGTGDAVGRR